MKMAPFSQYMLNYRWVAKFLFVLIWCSTRGRLCVGRPAGPRPRSGRSSTCHQLLHLVKVWQLVRILMTCGMTNEGKRREPLPIRAISSNERAVTNVPQASNKSWHFDTREGDLLELLNPMRIRQVRTSRAIPLAGCALWGQIKG